LHEDDIHSDQLTKNVGRNKRSALRRISWRWHSAHYAFG